MSRENVDVVRDLMTAFSNRDAERISELMDPEAEFHSALVEKKIYRGGLAGVAQYLADLDAAWEEWRTENDRFRDAGDDRVLHLYRIIGRGKGSGVPVEQNIAILWQLRNHRLIEGRVYLDQREALEAAGLSE
jgi:ketosteroid isomerase-like protein